MTLSSIVVSRDWQEISVLECILGGLEIRVAIEDDPRQALDRLSKSKIDTLIVDCDLDGSAELLRELRTPELLLNCQAPLVIMRGPRCNNNLGPTGAVFSFEKPISAEQAVRTLSATRSMILERQLAGHHAGFSLPSMKVQKSNTVRLAIQKRKTGRRVNGSGRI